MFEIRVLSQDDVKKVLNMNKAIAAVESVYRSKAENGTVVWPTVFHDFEKGKADMDIKSGYVKAAEIHGMKSVSWFADNEKKGIPTLIGLILVFDSKTGVPIGILDAAYITGMRTGAAGAIGAKNLARKDSKNLFVLGAGNQAAFQIAAFLTEMPNLKKVRIADVLNPENAKKFAAGIHTRLVEEFGLTLSSDVSFEAVTNLQESVSDSDVIVTVTPSRSPVIKKEWVKPGTHLSCIGSDMEGKEEIEAEIFCGARIFADDKQHCMEVGEMELPLKNGVITKEDIAGEIGDLLVGNVQGRTSDEQITIFDATGMALLDLVTGKEALDAAEKLGLGATVNI